MLRFFPYVTGPKYYGLIEVESHLVFAEHGKNGATVTIECTLVERTASNRALDRRIAGGFIALCHVHLTCTRSKQREY
ncbi:MAG: hypothetical protein V3V40_01525 [Nitrosomonadaceae bacterium]